VSNLRVDLGRVVDGTVADVDHDADIVIGTIGVSAQVDAAIAAGELDVEQLRDEDGAFRWEGFLLTVVGDVLFLVGTDRRGTVYAVYDFLERVGVSPWSWWADVPVRQRADVTIARDTVVVDWPSVRYRGVFLNDEEELYHWARDHTADGTIGPALYERVFELLLRLKGNYLWPAMHTGAFNHDPANGRLAHDMGVIIGSSHCDMLLRSNEHEFHPWVEELGEPVRYDYSIPGRNRDNLRKYWRGSVEQNGEYEVTWTVGIRGVHDSGFETAAIDADPLLTDEEKFRARVDLLSDAIDDQRGILSDVLHVDATSAPQLFIPYKEVLPLFDAGLIIPDDVTIVWANDNFGHIRRFPSDTELTRSGGHGLYYHSSYWSNYTTSYLATSSTPLALMKSELSKAWDRGIRRLWVDNIGGLKPLEIEMTFFLRSAWEAGRETSTATVRGFVADWFDATFTGGYGTEAGDIYSEYYALNNQRKLEHLDSGVFAQTGWGDEAGRRVSELRRLYDRTNDILRALPADEKDAFFQLFAVKIHMTYLSAAQFYFADRSTHAHNVGAPAAADAAVAASRRFDDQRRTLIHFYNRVMADGKWDGMFTPEQFPPPVMPQSPAATPALKIDGTGVTAVAWGCEPGESPTLTFWSGGTASKWIDLFATGRPGVPVIIEADPGIRVQTDALVPTSVRVAVQVDGPLAGGTGTIRILAPTTGQVLTVPVFTETSHPGADAWSEADGVISIDPAASVLQHGPTSGWRVVPDLGRYGNAALQAVARPGDPDDVAAAGAADMRFALTTEGAHTLEVHRLPTLDSTGQIRIAVTVDGDFVGVVDSPTTDEHRGGWAAAIQDNIERLRLRLPHLTPGEHTLRLTAVDAGVTVSKVEIHTQPTRRTGLGAPFSVRGGHPRPAADDDPTIVDVDALDRDAHELYRTAPDAVPLRAQPYADRTFWDGETTFRPAPTVPQTRQGFAGPACAPDGSKDVLSTLVDGPISGVDGVFAFEAEKALLDSSGAWRTAGSDGSLWTHTSAPTQGGTGLALHVARRQEYLDPAAAPGIHFAVQVDTPGTYRAWALVHFNDDRDDSLVFAVDGHPQPVEEQFSRGNLCTYGARQVWLWAHISDLELAGGPRIVSVLARKGGLRLDRLYLTLGDEQPPVDADWAPSPVAADATSVSVA